MGNIRHETLIITANEQVFENKREEINAFRDALAEGWTQLVIGPVDSNSNGLRTMVFLPDGSKQGWYGQLAGHQLRDIFAQMFDDTTADIVHVIHGGDEPDEVSIKVPGFDEETALLTPEE